MDGKFEWLLGSIYLNSEGVCREENVKIIKAVVNKTKHEGLNILFGGRLIEINKNYTNILSKLYEQVLDLLTTEKVQINEHQ